MCTITDVEIMANPRPGSTFAHMFAVVVSAAGVHLFQGFGPWGYTLLQHMDNSPNGVLMTPANAHNLVIGPVTRFMSESASSGKWTETANEAYKKVFRLDLLKRGLVMKYGQLDAFLKVETVTFTAADVDTNFGLLPQYGGPVIPCPDKDIASGRIHTPHAARCPMPFKYKPAFVIDCSSCGKPDKKMMRCNRCKMCWYCSPACQREHWASHKKTCKMCAA